VSLFRFIDAERANYPVSLLCRVLGVSRSGYYAFKFRPPSRRSAGDRSLTKRIREVHERSRHTYGYPRVHAELKALGVGCGRRRVARLMREDGLRGCMRGKRRSTTRRDGNAPPAPDLVDRRFLAASPDRLWLADITCLPTREGFLYLSFILDACTRRVVGWAMASHLRAELVVDALGMALWRRNSPSGVGSPLRPGVAIYGALLRRAPEGGRGLPLDGQGGVGARQRHGRVVRIHAEGRNGSPCVRHEGSGEGGRLRLHRRLLQRESQALLDRIHESFRLRACHRRGGGRGLK